MSSIIYFIVNIQILQKYAVKIWDWLKTDEEINITTRNIHTRDPEITFECTNTTKDSWKISTSHP